MPIIRQHKSLLLSGITTLATAALLSGCASDPLPMPDSELYTRDFIKAFGTFDQSHDWNYATRTSVTVNAGTYTEVKVLADYDGKRYCFATFTDVKGRHTLNVDIPKGVTDLIVSANGRNYPVKAGGEVSIDGRGSRIGIDDVIDEEDVITTYVLNDENTIRVPGSYIGRYDEILPEDGQNLGREEVSFNFRFKNPGTPFVVYPVMWNTNQSNNVGIYWKDSDGKIHKQSIYTIKDGDQRKILGCTYQRPKSIDDYYFTEPKTNWIHDFDTDNPYFLFGASDINNTPFANAIRKITEEREKASSTSWVDWTKDDWDYLKELMINKGNNTYRHFTLYEIPDDWDTKDEAFKSSFKLKGWYTNEYIKYFGSWPNYTYSKGESVDFDGTGFQGKCDDLTYFSRGIVVELPSSIKEFGMYLRNNTTNGIVFSESELNSYEINWKYNQTKVDGVYQPYEPVELDYYYKAPYAATFNRSDLTDADAVNSFQRVAFEDCMPPDGMSTNGSTKYYGDFNDVVLYIKGLDGTNIETGDPGEEIPDEPEPPVVEEWEWIIACEDLGTNDFDFNDVVFSVSNPTTIGESGKKTVTIKALASGGTLPVYVKYNGTELKPEGNSSAEFHSWFGDYSSNTVINASGTRADGKSVTIEVLADFTMSCTDRVDEGSGNMGGFSVEVHYPAGVKSITATNPNFNESTMSPDLIGTAPQMICVPADWCWPVENKFILEVYNKFKDWCNSQTDNHWHSEDNRASSGYWNR